LGETETGQITLPVLVSSTRVVFTFYFYFKY
jgi:hypothetical protein